MVKMYLIDTNILLEVLLDQEMADECEKLILNLNEGHISAYISSFTLHSIEVILERNKKFPSFVDKFGTGQRAYRLQTRSAQNDFLFAISTTGTLTILHRVVQ